MHMHMRMHFAHGYVREQRPQRRIVVCTYLILPRLRRTHLNRAIGTFRSGWILMSQASGTIVG